MQAQTELMTIIIPAFNEEKSIERAYTTIDRILSLKAIPHIFYFVDDGSNDNTWAEISHLTYKKNNIKGISFSRNFGKEAAIYAGIETAYKNNPAGCFAVLDCDLQHPPEKLVDMYELWLDGYEVIEGVKVSRGKESALHGLAAKTFYSLMSNATGIDMSKASDFKLLDSKAVLALLNIQEKNAFFRALSSWIGFKTATVEFVVEERTVGESKWSTRGLIKYAINNITSFSNAPMQIVTFLGILVMIGSLILGCISLVQKFTGNAVEGFTTVIVLQLLSSSIIMISLGIIGYYISKIYDEIKKRPKYIVAKKCGGVNENQ